MIKIDEDIVVNPSIAVDYSSYGVDIPLDYIKLNKSKFGELSKISSINPVSNLQWKYYKFNNVEVFCPAALAFKQSERDCEGTANIPRYTPFIKGTKQYIDFWKEQRRRCLEGYEPIVDGKSCGIRITGEHYFYLNFCRIKQTGIDKITGEDIEVDDFPRFLTMDYYWFKELEARENPAKFGLPRDYKKSLIVAKARRMGFSFKNAAGAVWKFTFYANIKVAIISELGDKSIETFEKCLNIIDFLNQYTEFGGPTIYRTFNKQTCKGAIKAGVKTKDNQERGRKSEIYTISLHNRPDAASGAGCVRVIFEEAGMITKLDRAWEFTERTLRSGNIYKGIAIIFGTGGEMATDKGKAGSSLAFSKMFYNPEAYGLASFHNIYEFVDSKNKCGLFFNITWLAEGTEFIKPDGEIVEGLDKNGNINAWVAEINLNIKRKREREKDKKAYEISKTQDCKTPAEAFLMIQGSVFPVADIEDVIESIINNDDLDYISTHGKLVESKGKVDFRPDLKNELKPLTRFPNPPGLDNTESAVVVYEHPKTIDGVIPYGAYMVNIEPIGLDSEGGESMIAIYVVKTSIFPVEIGQDQIVAHYVGRPKYNQLDLQNEIALKLARYYNAMVTHENDRSGKNVRTYFLENKEYGRLMKPPVDLIMQELPNSRTLTRKTGYSMSSDDMKEIGEMYLLRWLMKVRYHDEEKGIIIRNLHMIKDIALLQELQCYSRGGNFDRVMCLMGIAINLAQLDSKKIQRENHNNEKVDEFFSNKHKEIFIEESKSSFTDVTDSRITDILTMF